MTLHKLVCSDEELANKLDMTRWANDFSWDQICTISQYLDAYKASAGTVIFEEGSSDNTMAIVTDGSIDIIKKESGSTANVIANIFQSQSFGEMSLIDGETRSAQAVARTNVELLFLSKENLYKLRQQNPGLAFDLLWIISQMLSQRLRRTSGNLVALMNKDACM